MNINSTSNNTSAAASKGLSGMVSGMDTDAMVESMLSGIQGRINKQKQSQQVLTWQQTKYREVIDKINAFQDKYLSLTSSTSLRTASSFAATTSKSSSNAVKILSSDNAAEGEFNVEVSQLAKAASVTSNAASRNKIVANAQNNGKYERDVTFTYKNGTNEDGTDKFEDIKIDLAEIAENSAENADGTVDLQDFADNLQAALEDKGLTGVEINFNAKDPADEKSYDSIEFKSGTEFAISGSMAGLAMLGFNQVVKTAKDEKKDESADDSFSLKSGVFNPDVEISGAVSISLDGKSYDFALKEGQSLLDISDKIKQKFGEGIQIKAYDAGGNEVAYDSEYAVNVELRANGRGRSVSITGNEETLGFLDLDKTNSSTRISLTASLNSQAEGSTAAEAEKTHKLTINGKEIEYSNKDSISQIMSKINNSGAGVKMSYNSLNDKFTIENTSLGSDFRLTASDDGKFLKTLGFETDGTSLKENTVSQGTNAIFRINGNEVERAGNVINYNGVTFELKKETSEAVEISSEKNVDKLYDTIKGFVDDYNSLIADLNKLTHEEATYKKYPALTDAQKKEMTEKEIELWEEKAKTGLLRNDSDISKFLQDMRSAMYTKGSATSLVLSNIGIDSSSNYKDYGKLVIDENKLKSALKSNTSEIADMFANAKTGLAARLNDICKATANTSSGSPGTLVSKAGVVGKASEKKNQIYDKLEQINTKLKSLNTLYDKKKNKYWKMFNTMETTLSKYVSQSEYFSQM